MFEFRGFVGARKVENLVYRVFVEIGHIERLFWAWLIGTRGIVRREVRVLES